MSAHTLVDLLLTKSCFMILELSKTCIGVSLNNLAQILGPIENDKVNTSKKSTFFNEKSCDFDGIFRAKKAWKIVFLQIIFYK